MNALISVIMSHLLTVIENEIASKAPEVVELIIKEVQLLIDKLNSYIGLAPIESVKSVAVTTPQSAE